MARERADGRAEEEEKADVDTSLQKKRWRGCFEESNCKCDNLKENVDIKYVCLSYLRGRVPRDGEMFNKSEDRLYPYIRI